MFRILRSLENPSLGLESKFGLFDDPNVEGEQAGGGDQGGEQGNQTGEGQHAKPGETGRPAGPGPDWIPKHRFDEVNTQFGRYKEFGKPEDVKRRLDRLAELEKLPQNRINDGEKAEIRKELLQVFPELQVLASTFESQRQAYTERGAGKNNKYLTELGIEANDGTNKYLQELLSGIIAADQKLLRRFYAMDDTVFDEAFAVAKKTFWPNHRKFPGADVQGKKTASKPPAQQKPFNDDGKPKDDKQLDRIGERNVLDEASEKAFAMLESSRTE